MPSLIRRATAVLAGLALFNLTAAGGSMSCRMVPRVAPDRSAQPPGATRQAPAGGEHEHHVRDAEPAGVAATAMLFRSASVTGPAGDAPPAPPACLSVSSCAVVLLGAGRPAPAGAGDERAVSSVRGDRAPPSRTVPPDLPPPKA
jgi:hypothetical protein